MQGDVIGVGYRPRTGTVFFTRNGKKLDDVGHGLKTQNFFPSVGANGPCHVHVNFGQLGFVFIEANVKKWGLAPMTGSLAPPPPYGSEQGSILLEGGRDREVAGAGYLAEALQASHLFGHARSGSHHARLGSRQPMSPGPQRSPTDISLAQLSLVDESGPVDAGEGTSAAPAVHPGSLYVPSSHRYGPDSVHPASGADDPPDYESSKGPPRHEASVPGHSSRTAPSHSRSRAEPESPPIPSYDTVVAERGRARSETR